MDSNYKDEVFRLDIEDILPKYIFTNIQFLTSKFGIVFSATHEETMESHLEIRLFKKKDGIETTTAWKQHIEAKGVQKFVLFEKGPQWELHFSAISPA